MVGKAKEILMTGTQPHRAPMIGMLRQAEASLKGGASMKRVCWKLAISE